MFAKDSPLAAEATKAIGEMKSDGFMAKLHETWFGSAPDAATSSRRSTRWSRILSQRPTTSSPHSWVLCSADQDNRRMSFPTICAMEALTVSEEIVTKQ